jgi:hypothetical protein
MHAQMLDCVLCACVCHCMCCVCVIKGHHSSLILLPSTPLSYHESLFATQHLVESVHQVQAPPSHLQLIISILYSQRHTELF